MLPAGGLKPNMLGFEPTGFPNTDCGCTIVGISVPFVVGALADDVPCPTPTPPLPLADAPNTNGMLVLDPIEDSKLNIDPPCGAPNEKLGADDAPAPNADGVALPPPDDEG